MDRVRERVGKVRRRRRYTSCVYGQSGGKTFKTRVTLIVGTHFVANCGGTQKQRLMRQKIDQTLVTSSAIQGTDIKWFWDFFTLYSRDDGYPKFISHSMWRHCISEEDLLRLLWLQGRTMLIRIKYQDITFRNKLFWSFFVNNKLNKYQKKSS